MERLNYVVIRGPKINYNGSLANFAQVPVILVPSLFFFALKLVCVIKVALQQFFGIYIYMRTHQQYFSGVFCFSASIHFEPFHFWQLYDVIPSLATSPVHARLCRW